MLAGKVNLKLATTPILFSNSFLYALPDSAYGEWIIFKNNIPGYYLNIFDAEYAEIIDNVKASDDAERYIDVHLKKNGHVDLALNIKTFGIPLRGKSKFVEFDLEKLPLAFIM